MSEAIKDEPRDRDPGGEAGRYEAVDCDVVVVLKREWDERVPEAIDLLRKAGMNCRPGVVSEEGAIEGTIDISRLGELKKLDCVATARCAFTYAVNHPAAGKGGAAPSPG